MLSAAKHLRLLFSVQPPPGVTSPAHHCGTLLSIFALRPLIRSGHVRLRNPAMLAVRLVRNLATGSALGRRTNVKGKSSPPHTNDANKVVLLE